MSPSASTSNANILIYSIEKNPQWEPFVRPLMAAIDAGQIAAASSELSYAEVMVRPFSEGSEAAVARYEDVFGSECPFNVVPVDRGILRTAAVLRGNHRLKLADAIHLASAIRAGCHALVTHDGPLGRAAAAHMRSRSLWDLSQLASVLDI